MASLQWTFIAGLLYGEIGLVFLMCIPFLKPWIWKQIFGIFKFFQGAKMILNVIYIAVLAVLLMLFIDSWREMLKFKEPASVEQHEAKLDRMMKEFRAQRNIYISGFALFLFLVIRRFSGIFMKICQLEASNAALQSQGRNQGSQLLQRLDSQEDTSAKDKEAKVKHVTKAALAPSREDYESLEKELKGARINLEAMKKQNEGTQREYDRVAEEYQKLQNKHEDEGKKDQ